MSRRCRSRSVHRSSTVVQLVYPLQRIQVIKKKKMITTGFSLSPGGLLLPYHLGVIDALQYNGRLQPSTALAGSSAGAIATVCAACELDSRVVLDATVAISDRCAELGGARGRLLPLLRDELNRIIGDEEFDTLQQRDGATIIAYRELFPKNQPIFQKQFTTREDLFSAVCFSSMFPFFATNWPATIDSSSTIPRIVVDGFFAVPRERFGCPDFDTADVPVDETVSICVFPNEISKILSTDSRDENDADTNRVICPEYEGPEQISRLFRLATEASSRKELTEVYESGYLDAERWLSSQVK